MESGKIHSTKQEWNSVSCLDGGIFVFHEHLALTFLIIKNVPAIAVICILVLYWTKFIFQSMLFILRPVRIEAAWVSRWVYGKP